jgi:shikimate dehydrogenase
MKNGLHFALVGENAAYSKSPAIFDAIYKAVGREGKFHVVQVNPNDIRASLNQLVLEGVRGFAVTLPYKRAVVSCLDDVDPVAHKVGAVNSVAVDDSCLYGYNTDCHGFAYPLLCNGKKSIGTSALIAGCGGAARAVAYSLYVDFGIGDITLLGRSAERLEECRTELSRLLDKVRLRTVVTGHSDTFFDRAFDIIVNASPLGGWNHPDVSPFPSEVKFAPGKIYYDLNYNDGNRIVAQAREKGLIALDGAPMLVAQAVRSFAIWTDIQVPFDTVFRTVFGGRRGQTAVQ